MKAIEALKMRVTVWIWNHTPTCAEMSRLSSQSLEEPLSLRMRFKMWQHYLICTWCKRYHKHLQFLHVAAARWGARTDIPLDRNLSPEAKQRMLERLRAG